MDRQCIECLKVSKTPYKDYCRNCYQKQWVKTINEKNCLSCGLSFKGCGSKCHSCLSNERNKKSREIPCCGCGRIGLIITNKSKKLCIKCNRLEKEKENESLVEKRRVSSRNYSRKKRGSDLDAPVRRPTGRWKNAQGYIVIHKKDHPNAYKNGCMTEHVFIMSQHIGRPLKDKENVHHINGIRDDNRIENLELWHRGQCPGQRLEEKIIWCKRFLEEYGYKIIEP